MGHVCVWPASAAKGGVWQSLGTGEGKHKARTCHKEVPDAGVRFSAAASLLSSGLGPHGLAGKLA